MTDSGTTDIKRTTIQVEITLHVNGSAHRLREMTSTRRGVRPESRSHSPARGRKRRRARNAVGVRRLQPGVGARQREHLYQSNRDRNPKVDIYYVSVVVKVEVRVTAKPARLSLRAGLVGTTA